MCLAVPGRLVETYVEHGVKMGRVDFGGVRRAVCVEHVPAAAIGDWLLVHVGFALTRLDPDEAARLFDLYRELDEVES
jgi:hydrogenase expression/formation protein HypC